MFVLPPQSPQPPVIAEASNAVPNEMSRTSTLLHVIVAPELVMVRAVPSVLDDRRILFVAELPAIVKTPVTVWVPVPSINESVLVAVPFRVRLVNVPPVLAINALAELLKTTV